MDQHRQPATSSGWLPPVPATEPPGELPPSGPAHQAPPPQPSKLRRWLGPVGVALLLALKYGKALVLLLPKAKVLTTSGSMLVSIGAYALIWGWKFAVGFVLLLFVHEMGHVIQLRREGVKASAPVFIPFLGAAVWAKSLGNDAAAEARVGLAGPVLGTIGAAACIPIYELTGNELFKALAFVGFFLNLFNLLPVVPLDGGRAMAAMAPWMWFVGLFGVVLLVFLWPNPIIILIALLGGMEVYRRWKRRHEDKAYYAVTKRQRVAVGAVYLGLIVLLVLGMDATHLERDFDDV